MARGSSKGADHYVRSLVTANPNLLVPHYLMACYLYYVEDAPVISDALFDEMSKELMAKWDSIQHWHKDLICLDDLRAGTGYALHYPERVKGAARRLRIQFDPKLRKQLDAISKRHGVEPSVGHGIWTYQLWKGSNE